jgi:CheY-like chemotaxis protein
MERMGGQIGARPRAEEGSVFWFEVSLPIDRSVRPASSPLPLALAAGLDARILVVDDNAVLRGLITQLLESMGCSVLAVAEGREAVEQFSPDLFDLVLMDCRMPGLDGFEATRAIRKLYPDDHTPFIALTAHATNPALIPFAEAGMDALLIKPFEAEQLRQVVGKLLTQEREDGSEGGSDSG